MSELGSRRVRQRTLSAASRCLHEWSSLLWSFSSAASLIDLEEEGFGYLGFTRFYRSPNHLIPHS